MTVPVNLQIFPIGKANGSPHRALDTECTLRQPQSYSQSSQDAALHCLGLLCHTEQATEQVPQSRGHTGLPAMPISHFQSFVPAQQFIAA